MQTEVDVPTGSGAAGQRWDADAYAANGRFVADLANEIVSMLSPVAGERILDLGCGDGALTERLASGGAHVTGCDRDASMLAAARARGLRVIQAEMTALPFSEEFDVVFSNAALHWVRAQDDVLRSVRRALRPGGRFVAEMGGFGNIATIRTAIQAVMQPMGIDAEAAAASFFPTPEEYRALLEQHGFQVEEMVLAPRRTLLTAGMEAWLRTFRNGVFDQLPEEAKNHAIAQTVAVLTPVLRDGRGQWWADYVRLRFRARLADMG